MQKISSILILDKQDHILHLLWHAYTEDHVLMGRLDIDWICQFSFMCSPKIFQVGMYSSWIHTKLPILLQIGAMTDLKFKPCKGASLTSKRLSDGLPPCLAHFCSVLGQSWHYITSYLSVKV